jgi:hypothetical protein
MGEDTAQVLIKDMPLIINILLWVLTCVFILYPGTVFDKI